MGIRKLTDLHAFLLAREFKRSTYKLVRDNRAAWNDLDYRRQLFRAVRSVEFNIAEGWKRYIAGDFSLFLRIALASLQEAQVALEDGVDCGYFTKAMIGDTSQLGNRCGAATMALWQSLQPFVKKKKRSG